MARFGELFLYVLSIANIVVHRLVKTSLVISLHMIDK